jgi:hypothetical protein
MMAVFLEPTLVDWGGLRTILDFSAEFRGGGTEFRIVLVEQFCGAFQELNVSLLVIDHLHWCFH